MLKHPKIDIRLNTDYFASKEEIIPSKATIYCGPVDSYFNYKLGQLPWRSLHFDFRSYQNTTIQACVQINYPEVSVPYTRTVEIKHATGQTTPNTTISYEYSRAEGDPYYPIPSQDARVMYEKYKILADNENETKNVFFSGRLAEYTYINMDQAIEKALETAKLVWSRINV
jgi:UDP-galactopyranose mutase